MDDKSTPLMQRVVNNMDRGKSIAGRGEKQARILGAARALMYEKGYNNFSLRAVAKASGYSPAGLYEHFENKAALCAALAGDAWVRFGKAMRKAAQNEQDPLKRLVRLCEAYVKYAHEYREDFLLLTMQPSPRKEHDQEVPQGSGLAVFLKAIADASEAGVIKARTENERLTVFYGLWTMAHGVAHLQVAHLAEFKDDFSEENRHIFEALLAGFNQKN